MTDALPVGLVAVSMTGSGWTCAIATLACTRSDVLPPSTSYPPVTVVVNVAANAPANLVNVATVSGGGETNSSNNTASAMTPLLPAAAAVESIPTLSTAGLATLGVLLVLLTAWRPAFATRARRRID